MLVVGTVVVVPIAGFLRVSDLADLGAESILVLVVVVTVLWAMVSSALGLGVCVGPRRALVCDYLFTTRVRLVDIDAVYVVDEGRIVLWLRDDSRVNVRAYQRAQALMFFGTDAADHAAERIRTAVRAAGAAGGGPVVLQRGWWPVPVHLTLAVLLCVGLGWMTAPII